MKSKYEVGHLLTSFYNMTRTQFDKRIKRIKTNHDSEYKSTYMMEFYREKGILLQTSCPYTPQQNDVV